MSKRGRRFSKKEMLAIVKEAKSTSSKAVREKYGISPSAYWTLRYQVTGVRLKKSFSPKAKLRILEEGYQIGILRTCNAYGIHMTSYYHWKSKLKFDKSPQRSFSEEKRLQIVNEAIRDGIIKVGDRHHLPGDTIGRWAQRLGFKIPRRSRFNIQEKLSILQQATRIGDGSLGFWIALQGEHGPVAQQRRWVHKTINILDHCCPK